MLGGGGGGGGGGLGVGRERGTSSDTLRPREGKLRLGPE